MEITEPEQINNDLQDFLENTAQKILENYDVLFNKKSTEENPYQYKYEGRDKLEILLKNPYFSEENLKENQNIQSLFAIVNFLLGRNFLDTEQSKESEKYFIETLRLFEKFQDKDLDNYYNYVLESKNSLGFLHLNMEEDIINKQGIEDLLSAKAIYDKITSKGLLEKKEIIQNNKEDQNDSQAYQPYYQGRFDSKLLETLHTLTLFYLAQGHTKLGQKEIGASYCGLTMQRQIAFNEYQVKDLCLNCVSLSEFYVGEKNFAQAQYLVDCAAEVLSKQEKKKKLKAIVASATGRIYQEFLNFSAILLSNYSKEELIKSKDQLEKDLNSQLVFFPELNVKFPKYTILEDLEQVKLYFRYANTQYKKAFTFFVLDGYVTEHVNILFEQSLMYKQLSSLESNQNRKFAMLERRRDLLESVLKQINPLAFIQLNQKLIVELAEIYIAMFDNRFDELILKSSTSNPKKSKIDQMNFCGQQGIKYYEQIEEILHKQKKDMQPDQIEGYYQSIINARFNMAKAYSKIYFENKQQKVDMLKKSLSNYRWMASFITQLQQEGIPFQPFAEQFKICKEMIDLLPNKIDKIAFSD